MFETQKCLKCGMEVIDTPNELIKHIYYNHPEATKHINALILEEALKQDIIKEDEKTLKTIKKNLIKKNN